MDTGTDVAAMFATAWNAVNDDRATAVDFWPCCRVLADANLLVAQETNLTAVSIGPFRFAASGDNRPIIDFVEVLVPSLIASAATGQAVSGAVSGVLTAACATFVKLCRQGVCFGRSETDRLRWAVLMMVRNANIHDVRPSEEAVVREFADRATGTAVPDAIGWLLGTARGRPPLLIRQDDGGLLATV
ncbi:hypothetical protein [Actinophytocola glycyrrhizae]|uniref:Uncharacterized protein n=1 Tax=Actinophytocola glycyrrhizae TaxID=2044873 RepID=A0ABV9SD93_9PSEU